MYPYVHYSIIHGGQDKETTEVSDRWLDKEDVVHAYNGVLLRHKKRRNTSSYDNMDISWQYHAKQSQMEKVKNHMISLTGGI